MALFNAPATVLPLYVRAPVAPSLPRRMVFVMLQLAAAAACGVGAVALPSSLLYVLIVPTGACLLIALWLMPDRIVFPAAAIARGAMVYFVLLTVWPVYIAILLPGLPWLTPTRMVLFVVTFLFLYSVATSGALRRHLITSARSLPLLWIAFLGFQASMIITIPFSRAISKTFKILVDNQLRLTEVFFIALLVYARRGVPTRTIGWLIGLAIVLAADGFLELHLGYPPWANHIPSFMKVDDETLANVLGAQARTTDGLYRVRGPFPLSLVFAEFLAMCMPFVVHWMLTGRTLLLRLAMMPTFVFLLAAVVITQSRLGLVGTIVAVTVYLPMWAYRQWRTDRVSLVGPSLLFGAPLIALAMLGVVFSSHTLKTRVLGGGAQAASNAARVQQRQMTVPKVAANPIGHGLGQSGQVLHFVNQAGAGTVDNHYLTTLLDLGIGGAVCFYGMFVVAAWAGVRLYLSTSDRETELAGPLGVMFVVFLVVKSVLSQENNHSMVMLLLGMLVALWARERRLFNPDNLFPRPSRGAVRR